MRTSWIVTIVLIGAAAAVSGQNQEIRINYDESKVPKYQLPDPLELTDSSPVRSAKDWQQRRQELLELFATHVYGHVPENAPAVKFQVVSTTDDALDGKAVRKEVDVLFEAGDKTTSMRMLLYLPARPGPHPVFLGLNFRGNHAIQDDPGITLSTRWMRPSRDSGVVDNRATEGSRGSAASRWPVPAILARGYGVATIYYGDIDPDFDDGFQNGIHPLFYEPGQTKPAADQWGSIAAWAWGLQRGLDYLQTDPMVDGQRVAVLGHSRLGKTALWAGATDERFAIVISNNSGCGGAALSRRAYGETVRRINTSFPHWFCDNFLKYNDREDELPVDSHELIALMAPRPVYVASATEDRWADPRGEFLSVLHASPVYRLLGREALAEDEPPPQPDQPLMTAVGYHLRSGSHDVTDYDWQRYMDFADKHYGRSSR